MRLAALTRRYAGALFGTARDADIIGKVEGDLGLIARSLQAVPRLQEALANPLIPAERKKKISAEVFGVKVQEITIRFLNLLIDKRREDVLGEVEQEYVRLANEFRGIAPAVAVSAVPLSLEEKEALRAKLEDFTGMKIELQVEEDSSLVGGAIVKIGDTVIDGSVRGYLQALREKLLE